MLVLEAYKVIRSTMYFSSNATIFLIAILPFMYNFTKTEVTYNTITTYKLQITIPINMAYNTNNITTFLTGVNSKYQRYY